MRIICFVAGLGKQGEQDFISENLEYFLCQWKMYQYIAKEFDNHFMYNFDVLNAIPLE